jgi:hydroxymethylbilane synthase
MRTVTVGTRQSALALTQTNQVIEQLKLIAGNAGIECRFEIKKIVTRGDQILDVTLSKVGGKGLFVKEIEQALLDGTIDMAVHSMKDMPWERQEGLAIGGTPVREDPRDCLITRGGVALADLPGGARVGTSSLRRAAQLLAFRPDLNIESIRGNIDSRLRKLETEGFDAIVLAAAGLHRMGWKDRITEYLSPDICIPTVAQGALGIECRVEDTFMLDLLGKFEHADTVLAVTAERQFLGRLNGGCQIPIGAHAIVRDNPAGGRLLEMTAVVGSPDGSRLIKEWGQESDPVKLGDLLADKLIAQGADRIIAELGG